MISLCLFYQSKGYCCSCERSGPWASCSNIWTEQRTTIFTDRWISAAVIQSLQDQFIQKLANDIDKGKLYKINN